MPRSAVSNRFKIRDMGTCLNFDGVDDVVTVAHSVSVNLDGPFTMLAWINTISLGESNSGRIFDKGNAYLWQINSFGGMTIFNGASSKNSDNGIISSLLKKWIHVGVTYDGSNIRFYINGTIVGSPVAQTTNPSTNSNDLTIGNRAGTDRTFSGKIDEPTIFKGRALTAAEISQYYYTGVLSTTNLSGRWLFDEGSGTTATDSSGNGNTGTITGATYSTDVPLKPRTAVSGRVLATGRNSIDGGLYNYIRSLSGLVAYYPLDELSGGYAFNHAPDTYGTLNGVVSGATQAVAGQVGRAYSFASGNYINASSNKIISGQQNFSISIIFKTSNMPPDATHHDALYCERPNSGNEINKIEITSSGTLRHVFRDNAGTLNFTTFTGGISVVDNEWHLLTFSKNGTSVSLYLDGATYGTASGLLTANDTFTSSSIISRVAGDATDIKAKYTGLIQQLLLKTTTSSLNENIILAQLAGLA